MKSILNQKNEIINLLNTIRLKHSEVNITKNDSDFNVSGFISRVDKEIIQLVISGIPDQLPLKNLVLNFQYVASFYHSSEIHVRLLNVAHKAVEITIPEKLEIHPKRRFKRYDLMGQDLKFKIIGLPLKSSISKSNVDELPDSLKGIYMELETKKPNMKKIIKMVSEELKKFSNLFKINIFREDVNLTPLEKVVANFNKTFWIEDTENLNSYLHLRDQYNVIGYEKYFEMMKRTISPALLEEIRGNYRTRSISSYSMVPIVIGDKVEGVIEVLISSKEEGKKLSIYEVFYIKGLADVLAEVILRSRSDSEDGDMDMNFEVVNISEEGIMVHTKNTYIPHILKEGDETTVRLSYEDKEIDIKSKVIRYEYIPGDSGGLNIAFKLLIEKELEKKFVITIIKKIIQYSKNKNNPKPVQSVPEQKS